MFKRVEFLKKVGETLLGEDNPLKEIFDDLVRQLSRVENSLEREKNSFSHSKDASDKIISLERELILILAQLELLLPPIYFEASFEFESHKEN